jgi:hypothetical protein
VMKNRITVFQATIPVAWYTVTDVSEEHIDLSARGSVVCRGTMLQAGRSRVRLPMRSLDL